MERKLLYCLLSLLLTACSETPDKYRDIKHLEMPPTLAIEHTSNRVAEPETKPKVKDEIKPAVVSQNDATTELEKLILIVGGDEKPRLQLKTRFDRAWELVNEGLIKAEIEVVDKNRDTGVYRVRYMDPTKERSRSFQGSLFSLFTDKFEDIEYTLTVEKDKKVTDVKVDKVVISQQENITDDTASLVKLLQKSIIDYLAK